MSENSRRGVAVLQWRIEDASRSMSWGYLLRALVVIVVSGLDGQGHIRFETPY
jgi:hypothetical protein